MEHGLANPLRPINLMWAIRTALLLRRLSSTLGYLVKMTADLLFGAAEFPKSLLNLLD